MTASRAGAGDAPDPRPVVVHFLSSLSRGGMEMRTLETIRQLGPSDPRVVVVQTGATPGPLTGDFERAGATVLNVRLRSTAFLPRVSRLLRDHRVVAVHTHHAVVSVNATLFLVFAALCGVPTRIAHYRQDGVAQVQRSGRITRRAVHALLDRCATDILGVSPSSLDRGWGTHWPADPRCAVVLSGVDLDRYDLGWDVRVRAELGGDHPVVLHVGRDVPVKNRAFAARVMTEVRRQLPDARLVFVGRDDPQRTDEVLGLGEPEFADAVRALGDRDDVPTLLRHADLLLATSISEGLPGVVVEAHAAGLPVVSSTVPGAVFLAEALPGIDVVDLSQPPRVWAHTVVRALTGTGPAEARRSRVAELRGTRFDAETAARRFVELWTSRPRR